VIQWSSVGDPARTGLIGASDWSDWCGLSAARVVRSATFSSRFRWLFAPRISSTSVTM
jgi:hypothetical protein